MASSAAPAGAALDIAFLQRWVGRTIEDQELAAAPMIRRLAATLDQYVGAYQDGVPMPEGWHLALFCGEALSNTLDRDGHPPRGDFLPPVPLPRRMFAGRRLKFLRPLIVGETVKRTATITSVTAKAGRSGALVFVTARYDLAGADGLAVSEEQDVVYRPPAEAGAQPAPASSAKPEPAADWSEPAQFDAATLFRFSAITFNAHRIHYDRDYARDVEGYPDLVVHAGLPTLRLLWTGRRWLGKPLAGASLRHVSPVYLSEPVLFDGRRTESGAVLRVLQGPRVCIEAQVEV